MRVTAPPSHCPSCGGPCPEATRACPWCGGPVLPLGAPSPGHARPCGGCGSACADSDAFCRHCGAPQAEAEAIPSSMTCPCCGDGHTLATWSLRALQGEIAADTAALLDAGRAELLHACGRCACAFVTHAAMSSYLRRQHAHAVADAATPRSPAAARPVQHAVAARELEIRYLRCPVCGDQMQRRNIGRVSGVIADVCVRHGVLFEAGELAQVTQFVRSGGLALTQQAEQQRERELQALREAARARGAESAGLRGGGLSGALGGVLGAGIAGASGRDAATAAGVGALLRLYEDRERSALELRNLDVAPVYHAVIRGLQAALQRLWGGPPARSLDVGADAGPTTRGRGDDGG